MAAAPVTNAEYLEFLDALVARGDDALALRYAPRDYHRDREDASQLWGRREDGTFFIAPDADGDLWGPDWPVMMIDVPSALAYLAWISERTGHAYRFPADLEWEKAARGVDRRVYPWGDHLDLTWAAVEYHDGVALVPADERPVDCSPYGVLAMAGAVSEWCLEERDHPEPVGPWVEVPPLALHENGHASRGGSWGSGKTSVRCATRGFSPAFRGMFTHGFRRVRSWP
ncbi:MAG: SUMF1/EgtB/PvdO family nonheme iron enzyme [Myxococcota bacterium]